LTCRKKRRRWREKSQGSRKHARARGRGRGFRARSGGARALSLSLLSSLLLRTGVIWVENRDQMMPVADTAHCWGVEMVSGGRLLRVDGKERGRGRG
jgi:hypothetical protein